MVGRGVTAPLSMVLLVTLSFSVTISEKEKSEIRGSHPPPQEKF